MCERNRDKEMKGGFLNKRRRLYSHYAEKDLIQARKQEQNWPG